MDPEAEAHIEATRKFREEMAQNPLADDSEEKASLERFINGVQKGIEALQLMLGKVEENPSILFEKAFYGQSR